MANKFLSTTALARQMGKESKELFVLLAQGGWILKVDHHWQLTEKGRFEGGTYVNHPKYGEYIAWPESVTEHPIFKLLPDAPLTATNLGQKWEVPARMVNLLLAERGFITRYVRGWNLTPQGASVGGQQQYSETGVPFTTWPETLIDDASLTYLLAQVKGEVALGNQPSIDGHATSHPLQRRIDNWLYLNRISHAVSYRIERDNASVIADFYVPAINLCIECWADALASSVSPASYLEHELDKTAFYRHYQQPFIECIEESLHQLDERLLKEFLQRGVAV